MLLLEDGNISNVPTKQFLLEKEEDFEKYKDTLSSAAPGSSALIPTTDGLVVKIKKLDGTWVAI